MNDELLGGSAWSYLWDVFHRARGVEGAQRAAVLDELCGSDERLRAEVEELLGADQVQTSPLDRRSFAIDLREPVIPAVEPGILLCERFEIVRVIGEGGMGRVYEAVDRSLGGHVALKTLLPRIADDPRARQRFYREIDLARQVTHPNVCRLFDLFEHRFSESESPMAFVTMELLEGETLSYRLRNERPSVGEALDMARQIAAALDAAHACGIIHRDLKPGNIILTRDHGRSRVVVTDFGLALRAKDAAASGERVTRPGQLFGTPAYMAPEQLLEGEITPATDVYAFGTILYEMITGVVPFSSDSPMSAAIRRLREGAPSPRQIVPTTDAAWERTIARCLERDPRDRFHSASEVIASLSGEKVGRPGLRRVVAAGAGVVLAIVAVVFIAIQALRSGERSPVRDDSSRSISFRQVWSGDELFGFMGTVSSDGRLMSYVDYSTGDLALRDLTRGESRRLTDKGPWTQSRDFAEYSAVSPDGQRVAYGWGTEDGFELRVIGTDLSRPQLLYRPRRAYIAPFDWSPDGRSIIVLIDHAELVRQVAMVSATDGAMKIVKSWNARSVPTSIGISPDGRFIAYDLVSEGSDGTRDIYVVSIADGTDMAVIRHPADDRFLEWTPDGNNILFLSNRSGDPGLWSVPVDGARTAGEPALLRERIGAIVPLGFTRENVFSYASSSSRTDVFTAQLAAGWPVVLAGQRPLAPRAQGQTDAPAFSLDGKSIVWVRENGVEIQTNGAAPRRFSGSMRRLALYSLPLWSADARSLVLTGTDVRGVTGFHQLDLSSGSMKLLLRPDYGERIDQPHFSPDGNTLFYISHGVVDARPWRVLARDLATGRTDEIYRSPADEFRRIALAPHGREIALIRQRDDGFSLELVPARGGRPRELLRFEERSPPRVPHVVAWMADSESLLISRNAKELWQVNATTGSAIRIASMKGPIRHVSVDRVLDRIAWSSAERVNEVWMIENLTAEIARRSTAQ